MFWKRFHKLIVLSSCCQLNKGNTGSARFVIFSVETLKSRVDSLKDEGNALHKKRKFAQAVSKYTEAIDAIKNLDKATMRAEGVTQRDLAVLYRLVGEGVRVRVGPIYSLPIPLRGRRRASEMYLRITNFRGSLNNIFYAKFTFMKRITFYYIFQ